MISVKSMNLNCKREAFKDQNWFEHHIKHDEELLLKFIKKAKNDPISDEERVSLKETIFQTSLEHLIMRYSSGEDTNYLLPYYINALEALRDYHSEPNYKPLYFKELDDYIIAIWLVSIGVLLEIDGPTFETLVMNIGNKNKDSIYDYIVNYRINNWGVSSSILHEEQYSALSESLFKSGVEQVCLIEEFIKTYYYSMSSAFWHDRHLGDDTDFFGYWCFELAAIVKISNVDDTDFSNNIFYPRDLLGKKLYKTWEDSLTGESDRKEFLSLRSKNK